MSLHTRWSLFAGCTKRSRTLLANDPVLIAYTVKNATPKRKARWTRIGVAFPHDRGAGLTLLINALPLRFDGRIVLLEPSADYKDVTPAILAPHKRQL